MDLIIELYSEYINDNQYVYYKNYNTIIIMKKITDDFKCLSEIQPKKYHSDSLKVIIMFNITDPYKLVPQITKYKINELTETNYYKNIQEAYTLNQEYYESGQLWEECNFINNKLNGICQEYYESGQLNTECNFINNKRNGLYQEYYDLGMLLVA